MQKGIAFFDFDGTITRSDTMIELAKFASGSLHFFVGMLRISPWLIAMKLKLVSNENAKEKMLARFYKGYSLEKFNALCQGFSEKILPGLIRPDAMEEIQRLKDKNIRIVVVTASAQNWVEPWCKKNELELIATKLEVVDDTITGKLLGSNCNAEEKVCRIQAAYHLDNYKEIYAYGDSAGDQAMLQLATHPHYRKFKR